MLVPIDHSTKNLTVVADMDHRDLWQSDDVEAWALALKGVDNVRVGQHSQCFLARIPPPTHNLHALPLPLPLSLLPYCDCAGDEG